jgi:CubicO group peptidase (beta-lactamase class C family)
LVVLAGEGGAADKLESKKRPVLDADRDRFQRLEQQLDQLRGLLRIPGLSAAVIRDQEVVWDKGFGFANLERRVPATPDTPYHVASLTKTFAATLILQFVEQGKLDLEEPASRYSAVKGDRIKIRHLLAHTVEGIPGERFHYTAGAYAGITQVLEKVSGKSVRELMVATFVEPLHMERSVPGHDMLTEGDRWADRLGKVAIRRYQEILKDLARPYHLYGSDEVVASPQCRGCFIDACEGLVSLDAREGLISTVRDLAKYNAALDHHQFLSRKTQERAWTPAVSNGGQPLPHGLGWFVQSYRGEKLVWHYGYWPNNFSALLLKVPERNLTLILLANSDGLSAPFYDNWRVETSVFASCFLRLFVFDDGSGQAPPDPPWAVGPQEFERQLVRLRKQTDYPYASESLAHAAMTKWLAERRARAHTSIKVKPDHLSAYVGLYRLPPNRVLTVKQEGDGLTVDFPGRTRFSFLPWAEGRFFLKVLDLELTFARDEEGHVSRLEIEYEGQKMKAKKVN